MNVEFSTQLIKSLYQIGVIRLGEFTLKSGKKSPYYVDFRVLPSHPNVLKYVGIVMSKMIKNLQEKPTRLCGIPASGLSITNVIGIKTGIPICYTRKEPIIYKGLAVKLRNFIKEGKYEQEKIPGVEDVIKTIEELSGFKTHGIPRYIDGDIRDGDKILIVDDVITDGESKLEAIDLIRLEEKRRNINVNIIGIYVLLDREQGGKEALKKVGLPLYSVVTIREVAKYLLELGILTPQMYQTIVDYTIAERKAIGLE